MENQETNIPPYTDYRIGNLIYYEGELVRLKDLDHFTVICIAHGIYKPVPISEDLLLKAEFSKESYYWKYKDSDIKLDFTFSGYSPFIDINEGFKNNIYFTTIYYFHQLQNLYYILEGKELEIVL